MKTFNKINPIAKLLRDRKYNKQVIRSKKRSKVDRLSEREARDAGAQQDS